MRVGLVTNWGDHCSISEYAKNLIEHLPNTVDLKVVGHPLTFESIVAQLKFLEVDIIHFNYINFWIDHSVMEAVAATMPDKKFIVTYQEKPERSLMENSRADRIVLHDVKGDYPSKVRLIPNGIRIVDTTGFKHDWVSRRIGSAGFAAYHKGFVDVAQAAQEMDMGCRLLMSAALGQKDVADKLEKNVKTICPRAEVDTGWLQYDDIVRRMAECVVTVFPYDMSVSNVMPGIGNAVRFGLASGRPVIVPKGHSHFRDLAEYPDEIYFYEDSLLKTIGQACSDMALGRSKKPKRILEDMNWARCAQMYADLYEEVLA